MLPAIISAFILSDILKKEGYNGFTSNRENLEVDSLVEKAKGFHEEPEQISLTAASEGNMELNVDVAKGSIVRSGNCGGGCGGCGSGCGDMVSGNSGDSGCGDTMKSGNSGGCGGCGGGCGNMVRSGN